MRKKYLILLSAVVILIFIAYNIGFYRGCSKVVGNWEGAYITDGIIQSHCYGDRSMWLDDVERGSQKK